MEFYKDGKLNPAKQRILASEGYATVIIDPRNIKYDPKRIRLIFESPYKICRNASFVDESDLDMSDADYASIYDDYDFYGED